MYWLIVALLLLVLAAAWALQLVGAPGNWLIVAAMAVSAFLAPEEPIGWQTVAVLTALATGGELAEFAAGAAGVAKAGGSRRAALLSLVGGALGGIVGVVIGLPIPVIGSLVAAVLGAAAGAMLGAFIGEKSAGADYRASRDVAQAAFVGRVWGTLAKIITSSIMVAVGLVALLF